MQSGMLYRDSVVFTLFRSIASKAWALRYQQCLVMQSCSDAEQSKCGASYCIAYRYGGMSGIDFAISNLDDAAYEASNAVHVTSVAS